MGKLIAGNPNLRSCGVFSSVCCLLEPSRKRAGFCQCALRCILRVDGEDVAGAGAGKRGHRLFRLDERDPGAVLVKGFDEREATFGCLLSRAYRSGGAAVEHVLMAPEVRRGSAARQMKRVCFVDLDKEEGGGRFCSEWTDVTSDFKNRRSWVGGRGRRGGSHQVAASSPGRAAVSLRSRSNSDSTRAAAPLTSLALQVIMFTADLSTIDA